jgi:hypothetical protein
MIITYPTNIDYLIPDVRLRIGDYNGDRFSDPIIRSSLLAAVKMLQRKWKSRYLLFYDSMLVDPVPIDVAVPSGYVYAKVTQGYAFIPAGLHENDAFKNPYHIFTDPGSEVFSQEDEEPIILAATLVLRAAQISSSAAVFQIWSDGEYSFSNVASSAAMDKMYQANLASLEAYFKSRLASPIRQSFSAFVPYIIPHIAC